MARTRDLRICLIGPSPRMVGGQAVQAQRLHKRLSSNARLEVTFLPIDPRVAPPLRFLQRLKYVRTAVTSCLYGLSLLRRVPGTDVVHVFSASYWSFLLCPVPALLVGRLLGKAVIINYRSGEADDHLSRWRTAVPLLRMCDLIVVPSEYLVGVFARHGLQAHVVPNFVEVDHFPYRRREALRPLFLSNRSLQKLYNVSCILRAFARIQARLPDARLTVAGNGPLRADLEREAGALGLRNVTFCGDVSQQRMAELYDAADVYLNAPDIDNMPGSVLEAATCGLPIVSTDAGGIPFIVKHGVSALLTPRGDGTALADAALRLFDEEGLAARLAAAARNEVLARYTWPAVEAGWLRTYQAALGAAATDKARTRFR